MTSKISMAALQGYFLRNKDDAEKAIGNISTILDTIDTRSHTISATGVPHASNAKHHVHRGPVKPRAVKPLTADQVDRMVFNPQAGWDKDL
jgi:hypothetical protein